MEYSVLMAVYIKDNAQYLDVAIKSMLEQTIKPEQFVVVKDGEVSEDANCILQTYAEQYPDIFTIVALEKNRGLAFALNEGLKHCRNELVARMDADDISLPKRCERELEFFGKNKKLDICGCNIDEFYGAPDDVRTSRVVPSEHEEILKFMRKRQPFNHPTVMYRKSKVLASGGYPQLKRKEDFDLFSRMLRQGCCARNINESLYLYRADENNYKRRKSFTNTKSAIYVYWRHLKRKGCSLGDFIVICSGEILFYILPCGMMKKLSDKILREKAGEHN